MFIMSSVFDYIISFGFALISCASVTLCLVSVYVRGCFISCLQSGLLTFKLYHLVLHSTLCDNRADLLFMSSSLTLLSILFESAYTGDTEIHPHEGLKTHTNTEGNKLII